MFVLPMTGSSLQPKEINQSDQFQTLSITTSKVVISQRTKLNIPVIYFKDFTPNFNK
jgi:hypothetical protein